jgi:uncharacterized membrane protein
VDPKIVSSSENKNVQTIAQFETEALRERSLTDRISDAITRFAGFGVLSRYMSFGSWHGFV